MRYFFTVISTFILLITSVNSQNYRILRHFTGKPTDASHPQGALLLVDSTFYATSHWGGVYDKGCVYRMTTDGSYLKLLHSFDDIKTGAYPLHPLLYIDTLLYGITQGNTFFSIERNGNSFKTIDVQNPDSAYIYGSFIKYGDFIYGTETYSGVNVPTRGALIKYKIDGTDYKTLKAFFSDSSDGVYPSGPFFTTGNRLYGYVQGSGSNPYDMMYSINPDGSNYTIVHKFSGGKSNGGEIVSPLILLDNQIYGITNRGGLSDSGVVFRIDPDGNNFKILHNCRGDSIDGALSWSKLLPYGNYLLGITKNGGLHGKGAIFKTSMDGSEYKILYYFGDRHEDGFWPNGDMTLVGNTLYGTTWRGGKYDLGTIFRITELDFWDSCGTESFNYPYFITSDGLKLNGYAVTSDSAINLVQSVHSIAGSAIYRNPVNVAGGFKSTFSFRFSDGWNSFTDGTPTGADGIVFLIQAENNSILGTNGGGLGYFGVPNSLAVEFDAYRNSEFNDPLFDHIAVFSNRLEPNTCVHKSNAELGFTTDVPKFRADSSLFFVKIDYSAFEKKMTIWLDKNEEYKKPALVIDSLNLSSLLNLIDGNKAFIGFTSATGTSHQRTDLLNWSFCPYLQQEPDEVKELPGNAELNIIPNPARDYIEIDVGNRHACSLPGNTIHVYNAIGECVGAGSEPARTKPAHIKIDISGLPPGVYIVRCGGSCTKFVKGE